MLAAGLAAAVIGIVIGVAVAWLVLSGVFAMAFRRARMIVRRIRDRRSVTRATPDRRQAERREEATSPPPA